MFQVHSPPEILSNFEICCSLLYETITTGVACVLTSLRAILRLINNREGSVDAIDKAEVEGTYSS